MQYFKLSIKSSENAEELMERFQIAEAECNYKEIPRHFQEQFIHGLNDNNMLIGIIHELSAIKYTSIVTSEQVLAWTWWFEAQRTQTVILDSWRETKDFDPIQSGRVGQKIKPVTKTPA